MAKKKKVRVDLRRNLSKPPRQRGWKRQYEESGGGDDTAPGQERVRARGDLSRKRTIIQEEAAGTSAGAQAAEMPAADPSVDLPGRIVRVHRLHCVVQGDDGRQYRCAVRRLLRSLATDERSVVTTGDRVWFRAASQAAPLSAEERQDLADVEDEEADRPAGTPAGAAPTLEGFIVRVEPRHGVLTRLSRKREHVLVANVDQVVFVMSLVEPDFKPHLLDRYLASAEQGGIRPLICLNKADLVPPYAWEPTVGYYSQLGIPTLLTSAATGQGIDLLRQHLAGRATVFSGQSGVGKSSLLNAIQPGLALRVREVSDTTQKGKHTTVAAELIQLETGGWVVDTPGVRQFQLYNILPEEVEGFFPEFRPFVPLCAFPDCTHTHEERCAVKRAVARRQISASRYTSYLGIYGGEMV
jgi:ribosome biogenesis GTPase